MRYKQILLQTGIKQTLEIDKAITKTKATNYRLIANWLAEKIDSLTGHTGANSTNNPKTGTIRT